MHGAGNKMIEVIYIYNIYIYFLYDCVFSLKMVVIAEISR